MDPRSPFVLDIREVGRQPGSCYDYHRETTAPAQLGLDMIGVEEGSRLVYDVRLEAVTEGILATGSVGGSVRGECGRCLTSFTDVFDVSFVELFAFADSATEATTDPDEVSRIKGAHIDLEPVVRDAVVVSLPLTPLCRPDCPGLCPECGERLEDLPAGHSHARLDPRWAALAERFAEPEPTQHPTE